jgi:periplasmic divalent cation tolerance protein
LVLTTCANREEADDLATALVEARLAACVNRLDGIGSTFLWHSKLERDEETLVLIKTTEDRFAALEIAIRDRASYELPEVIAVPVHGGSAEYLEWLEDSVADKD